MYDLYLYVNNMNTDTFTTSCGFIMSELSVKLGLITVF
jgi:hypothetical protein